MNLNTYDERKIFLKDKLIICKNQNEVIMCLLTLDFYYPLPLKLNRYLLKGKTIKSNVFFISRLDQIGCFKLSSTGLDQQSTRTEISLQFLLDNF